MSERTEIREGREFKVTVLPPARPPKSRTATTHYHMAEVDKPGEAGHFVPMKELRGKSGIRKKKRT